MNYLYFIIITGFGIKFLFQRAGKVRHPLNKEQMLSFDGPELFWTLTFSTGLLALSAPGALDLMAIRLLVLECLCLIGLFVVKRRPVWSAVSIFYLLYIASLYCFFCFSEYSGTFSVLFISNNILKLSGTPSNAFLHASLCCFATAISCCIT